VLRVFLLVLLLVGVSACSLPLPGAPLPALALAAQPEPVSLWEDASIFQLEARLITQARSRVLVEMYELGRTDLVADLGAAHARGVEVRVITDPTVVVSRVSADELDRLGVPERLYPIDDSAHQIDHVKLLIADGEAAVGGMNWGAHSALNHDYVLETRVAAELQRLTRVFEQDWSLAGGTPEPLAAAAGEIGQTAPGEEIRAMLGQALSAPRVRVLVEMYTLTDPDVIGGLASAHDRGVDVRVLLDPNQAYNLRAFDVLRSAGVRVRWYPIPRGALLHAKIGLFYAELVLGSANWTYSGLDVNHELDIETRDPTAVAAYWTRFEADWARSPGV
jgi:phosphatidylserine/phosphatidylglycerophosphate/cardiolipin synthase-like enzyme